MDIRFDCAQPHMQMSENLGLTITLSLRLKENSEYFKMTSGLMLSECSNSLTIHSQASTPHVAEFEKDGRLGEIRHILYMPSAATPLLTSWLHIPANEFDALLRAVTNGISPSEISLGLNDGYDGTEPEGLIEGVWRDAAGGVTPLPIRGYLITFEMVGWNGDSK